MTIAYSYIRFSTKEQAKGDSFRRQTEASEKYVKEHPELTLDTSLKLFDSGVSAAKGLNRIKGALGEFLKLVENGTVKRGSFLIVENLDRLSRQDVLTALKFFISIIEAGITIVTIQDRQEYSETSITDNWSQLIISITYMARASDETNTKRIRVGAAWEKKRENATNGNHKLTARCSLWLRLSKDRTKYILIPEVCKVIETIYHLKLSGKSKTAITIKLNQMPDIWKPPVTKRNKTGGWREDYIQKILTTPAVIGTFQPCKRVDDKKTPVGVPIINYFPAAIDKQLFNEVQAFITRNKEKNNDRGNGGGQTGKAKNLFVGLVKCGLCKHPMHNQNKGHYDYLYCDISRRKYGCDAKSIRYDEFEELFFKEVDNLNISDLMPDADQMQIDLNDINRRMTAYKHELSELESTIEFNSAAIFKIKDEREREAQESLQTKARDQRDELNKLILSLTKEQKTLKTASDEFQSKIDTTKEVYQLLKSAPDEQANIDLRLRLRVEISKLVKSIEVYPLQEEYKPIEEIEPDIFRTMKSKYIERFVIKYNETKKVSIIYLRSGFEAETSQKYIMTKII